VPREQAQIHDPGPDLPRDGRQKRDILLTIAGGRRHPVAVDHAQDLVAVQNGRAEGRANWIAHQAVRDISGQIDRQIVDDGALTVQERLIDEGATDRVGAGFVTVDVPRHGHLRVTAGVFQGDQGALEAQGLTAGIERLFEKLSPFEHTPDALGEAHQQLEPALIELKPEQARGREETLLALERGRIMLEADLRVRLARGRAADHLDLVSANPDAAGRGADGVAERLTEVHARPVLRALVRDEHLPVLVQPHLGVLARHVVPRKLHIAARRAPQRQGAPRQLDTPHRAAGKAYDQRGHPLLSTPNE